MIWSKTDAGRVEMQARALVKERSQRNLLLLIDGVKTEEMLLANVVGVKPEDFQVLESLQLIARVHGSSSRSSANAATVPAQLDETPDPNAEFLEFAAKLMQMISSELGLRGFSLTLAVEKATTLDALGDVATRVLDQIRDRKGLPAAEKARRTLYGN